jgi:hypothetical protein
MQLRHFVSVSSVILVAWLAATFVREVPCQRYPKLEKYSSTTQLTPVSDAPDAVVLVKDIARFPVSVSR